MRVPFHQVDAFTASAFTGNPAAVVQLRAWLPDGLMQSIAAENNLSETAFVVPAGDARFELRWMTPLAEVALCGHATLATAHVLFDGGAVTGDVVTFETRQSGDLVVTRTPDGLRMDFPVRGVAPDTAPADLLDVVGVPVLEYLSNDRIGFAVVADAAAVRAAVPDPMRVLELPRGYLIVTAPGDPTTGDAEFVSRFFAPAVGVPEDPVTGSAHCALAPFWAERLGRADLRAHQLSRRGGALRCEMAGDRVFLTGRAVTVITGELALPGE